MVIQPISEKKGNSTVQCIESKSRLLGFDLVYQNFVGGGSQTLESHCIFGYFSSFQQPVAPLKKKNNRLLGDSQTHDCGVDSPRGGSRMKHRGLNNKGLDLKLLVD
jgi:hypothetical protein